MASQGEARRAMARHGEARRAMAWQGMAGRPMVVRSGGRGGRSEAPPLLRTSATGHGTCSRFQQSRPTRISADSPPVEQRRHTWLTGRLQCFGRRSSRLASSCWTKRYVNGLRRHASRHRDAHMGCQHAGGGIRLAGRGKAERVRDGFATEPAGSGGELLDAWCREA